MNIPLFKVQKRLFAYDNPLDVNYGTGHIVSSGTFSKLLAPALRLGWLEMPPAIRKRYWENSPILISGGSLNTMIGGCVADLLASGDAAKHIARAHAEQKVSVVMIEYNITWITFQDKMATAIEIFNSKLPQGCKLINSPKVSELEGSDNE